MHTGTEAADDALMTGLRRGDNRTLPRQEQDFAGATTGLRRSKVLLWIQGQQDYVLNRPQLTRADWRQADLHEATVLN